MTLQQSLPEKLPAASDTMGSYAYPVKPRSCAYCIHHDFMTHAATPSAIMYTTSENERLHQPRTEGNAMTNVTKTYSMPEGFNPYGLYRNIVSRSSIPLLKSDSMDDQTQEQWLCFRDKDGVCYLLDTYHIDHPSIDKRFGEACDNWTDAYIAKRIAAINEGKDESYTIAHADFDYYYGGAVKVTESSLGYFECVCDLRDMRLCDNPEDYRSEDVVNHAQLWFEHGYPGGVSLVRRDATVDNDRKVLAACDHALSDCRIMTGWVHPEISDIAVSDRVAEYRRLVNEYIDTLDTLREQTRELRYAIDKIRFPQDEGSED